MNNDNILSDDFYKDIENGVPDCENPCDGDCDSCPVKVDKDKIMAFMEDSRKLNKKERLFVTQLLFSSFGDVGRNAILIFPTLIELSKHGSVVKLD